MRALHSFDGRRTKKLQIAIQILFKRWGSDGGNIPCEACYWTEDEGDCEFCGNKGFLWIEGKPADVLGSEMGDVMITAWMIFTAREKQWMPIEYLDQSPKYLQAYHYCLPFISAELEADWDRKRRESESSVKRLG